MMKKYLAVALLLTLAGCKAIEYHPYDVAISTRNINAIGIEAIENECAGKQTIRFAWMGDSQRWYDETAAFVRDVNNRGDIDFVIHGGDITDFGLGREYDWVHDIMGDLKVPYVALIGNHDILGNGVDIFKSMYGPLNFSFIAGDTKFMCLNTNALEFDYQEPVPDFEFMLQQVGDTTTRNYHQTIVAMHSNPTDMQFNNNSGRIFQSIVKQSRNLMCCLHAHTHRYEGNDYFGDGVMYYSCASMKARSYLLFTVTKDNYSYELINF